jgi:uncharacterized protein
MMAFGNTMSHSFLILGASTRAAAFSALAAGLSPECGDRFADADLSARCPVVAVDSYPGGFERIATQSTAGAWLYTGGIENHPALVERISGRVPLYGNRAATLERVRDPFILRRALVAANLASPEVRATAVGLPRDGSWLRKSRRSAGGLGVASWGGEGSLSRRTTDEHYFQRFVAGAPCAAVYLSARGAARLLGVTEQLLAPRSRQDRAFCYAGSVGPLPLDDWRLRVLTRLGAVLASEFELQGLFGVDFIDDGHEVWPVEVNPRYTASTEVLERGLSFSAVGWHVAACRDGILPDVAVTHGALWNGKRIVYARHKALVSEQFTSVALACNDDWLSPRVADVPAAGTQIEAGQPAMTVFAEGASRAGVLAELDRAEQDWAARLAEAAISRP